MTTSDSTAERVAAAILRAGESRNSIATKTGIPYSTLQRRLIDGHSFTIGELARIADVLGISPVALMPDEFRTAHKDAA